MKQSYYVYVFFSNFNSKTKSSISHSYKINLFKDLLNSTSNKILVKVILKISNYFVYIL